MMTLAKRVIHEFLAVSLDIVCKTINLLKVYLHLVFIPLEWGASPIFMSTMGASKFFQIAAILSDY